MCLHAYAATLDGYVSLVERPLCDEPSDVDREIQCGALVDRFLLDCADDR